MVTATLHEIFIRRGREPRYMVEPGVSLEVTALKLVRIRPSTRRVVLITVEKKVFKPVLVIHPDGSATLCNANLHKRGRYRLLKRDITFSPKQMKQMVDFWQETQGGDSVPVDYVSG